MNNFGKTFVQIYNLEILNTLGKYQYILLSSILFFIPILLPDSQIITGSIINFCLIFIAFNYKKTKLIPAILLPSIANLLKGAMFGSFTPFLLIVLPAIWIGNFSLIFSLRYFFIKKFPIYINLLLSIIIKALLIFAITLLINQFVDLPKAILNSMGIMQFATAFIASCFFYLTTKSKWEETL